MQQSIDRSGGIHGNKGTEVAIAAIKMVANRLSDTSKKKSKLLPTGPLRIEGLPLELKENKFIIRRPILFS
jgi:6,7-dimethyl-8-ribityllumazine synthase